MGRILEEDAVLNEIGRWIGYLNEDMIYRIKIVIKKLPTAQQWIPCGEQPPDTNGVYNVTRKISDGFECRNISDACYYDGINTWHDNTRVNHGRRYLTDVIAWMPLPEPYRGEPCATE